MPQPTQVGPAPTNPPLYELPQTHTPLRRFSFQSELDHQPDRAWVSWLLHAIDNGVSIGYPDPRLARVSRNLSSAAEHPRAIDDELHKELEAGLIYGPYAERPLPTFSARVWEWSPRKTANGEL